jgi:NAD(P)H dehydrogenase (quinone)
MYLPHPEEFTTMRYAVTAVSGQLGREIVRKLTALPERAPVIGLARTPSKVSGLGIEVRPGDYDKPEQLLSSLQGVDALVIVSGMAPPEERIQQHRNVINAAKAAGVRKLVYTSIQGPEQGTRFSPVVQSNRQTEQDIKASGLDWAIGRNGIYIEPDLDYIDSYKARGEIANSAAGGKCGYTTRSELAHAYAALLTRDGLNSGTFDLNGPPISQSELAQYLSRAFATNLAYRDMTPEDFAADRSAALGDFIGPIIGGIYEGIRQGAYDRPGDFKAVTGRPHQVWEDYFSALTD